MSIKGKAWTYGDNIDTDVIIPGRYCHLSDPLDIAPHAMEDLDPEFAGAVEKGDILVVGENFGCGSSRELAPLAIKAAGVSCVIAKGFARIFYRNAINIGLPIQESAEAVADIEKGDEIEVDLKKGTIQNKTKGQSYEATAFPESIQRIIDTGGLIPYSKERARERMAQQAEPGN